jgi:hypothetical protein
MRPSVQNFAKLTLNDADARAGPKVVSWLDAIAERWLSTPAGTSKTDEVIESSAKTNTKINVSSCARVSLAILCMEIPRRPQSVAETTWPEPYCSRLE